MSNKKEASTGATADAIAKATRSQKQENPCKPSIPQSDLLSYIPTGRAHAITAKQLAARAGFKHVRNVTEMIHWLRCTGCVICMAQDEPFGYFLPDANEIGEVRRFIRQMYSRRREIAAATVSAEEYIASIDVPSSEAMDHDN